MKKLFALATSEVQDDVVSTEADVFTTSDEAHNAAMAFMLSRVGDFLDIDESDCLARKSVLDQYMSVETSEWRGRHKTAYVYRYGSLCVSATVQEVDWFKRVALETAWKVDGICRRIIEKLDPMSDEELHDAIQSFRNALEARKVAHELDKKS